MADLNFHSALTGSNIVASPSGSGVDIAEIQNLGMLDVRILPQGRKALTAATMELGFSLPHLPRTSVSGRGRTALWWSVDQWLVTCARARAHDLATKLETSLGRTHSMVTNVSDARCVIRISGDQTRELLMKGCNLDLLANDLAPGYVRRTQIAEIPVALHFVSDAPLSFDIYVFRSYATYIWQWLTIAGRASASLQLYGSQLPPGV